jgi:hypothetical protein
VLRVGPRPGDLKLTKFGWTIRGEEARMTNFYALQNQTKDRSRYFEFVKVAMQQPRAVLDVLPRLLIYQPEYAITPLAADSKHCCNVHGLKCLAPRNTEQSCTVLNPCPHVISQLVQCTRRRLIYGPRGWRSLSVWHHRPPRCQLWWAMGAHQRIPRVPQQCYVKLAPLDQGKV